MPSMLADSCRNRFDKAAGRSSSFPSRTCRSMSLNKSSTMILQPSCSPKKLTLEPTTGPRSRSTGCVRALRLATKRASTFVGCTGASDAPTSESGCSLRRRENRSESANVVCRDPGSARATEHPPTQDHRSLRTNARRLGAEAAPARPAATPLSAAPSLRADRLCAACPRYHGSGRPRQWPHAAR
jgi:hypothetical protein